MLDRSGEASLAGQPRDNLRYVSGDVSGELRCACIALLDGSQVDDGTAWEIGYFYAKKSPEQKIIGSELIFAGRGRAAGFSREPSEAMGGNTD